VIGQRLLLHGARALANRPYFRGRDRVSTALLRHAGTTTVCIDGLRIRLSLDDLQCQHIWRTMELPPEAPHLRALCRAGDVVVDAGANLGLLTLVAARAVAPGGRVVALEPSTSTFETLRWNTRGHPEIECVRAAVGAVDGELEFTVAADNSAYSSLDPEMVPGRARVERVRSVSLDTLCREHGIEPDIVKLDVEGAEWDALRGLGDRRPRTLVVETSARASFRPSAMCAWIAELGYDLELLGGEPYRPDVVDAAAKHDVVARRA
jgi:FkbM family methyltransferase